MSRCDGKCIYATREIEEGIETHKVELPALICVLKGFQDPTRPTINGVIKAQNSDITIYTLEDIGLKPEDVGIKGSPTYVSKAFRPSKTREECEFCIDCEELALKIKEFGGIGDE